jgi:hypothetical protein
LTFVPEKVSDIFSIFFTRAHSVFVIMLIIGITFIIWGILFKIFGWNMKFNKDEEGLEDKNSSNLKYKKKSK